MVNLFAGKWEWFSCFRALTLLNRLALSASDLVTHVFRNPPKRSVVLDPKVVKRLLFYLQLLGWYLHLLTVWFVPHVRAARAFRLGNLVVRNHRTVPCVFS